MGQSDWKMPLSWYLAMTGLRVAADQLADPAAGGSELPAENVNRLRALLPAIHEADSGRLHDLEYRVTLVAPMKAGKSTLLNAMLSQDLLPARGPAMTVLPTRVAVKAGAARQRSALVISHHQLLRLSRLAALIAEPRRREAVAAALQTSPLLQNVADSVARWPSDDSTEVVVGRTAVRERLSEVNDLLRLALNVLPGDDVLKEVQALGALRVYARVPWLDADPAALRLVLVDTPGPNEDLRPGALNGLVSAEVRSAHELLVVADATCLGNEAEASVRQVIRDSLPWPGSDEMLIAVNRADERPELLELARAEDQGRDGLAPELRAIWDRLAGGATGLSPRVEVTAARQALRAATVLRPADDQVEADRDAQAFIRLIRRGGRTRAQASGQWLKEQAEERWQESGVGGLLDSFLQPRAREPERYRLRALLLKVASALPPGWDGYLRDGLADVAKTAGIDWP